MPFVEVPNKNSYILKQFCRLEKYKKWFRTEAKIIGREKQEENTLSLQS